MQKLIPEKETFRLGEFGILLAELHEFTRLTKTEIMKQALALFARDKELNR